MESEVSGLELEIFESVGRRSEELLSFYHWRSSVVHHFTVVGLVTLISVRIDGPFNLNIDLSHLFDLLLFVAQDFLIDGDRLHIFKGKLIFEILFPLFDDVETIPLQIAVVESDRDNGLVFISNAIYSPLPRILEVTSVWIGSDIKRLPFGYFGKVVSVCLFVCPDT